MYEQYVFYRISLNQLNIWISFFSGDVKTTVMDLAPQKVFF